MAVFQGRIPWGLPAPMVQAVSRDYFACSSWFVGHSRASRLAANCIRVGVVRGRRGCVGRYRDFQGLPVSCRAAHRRHCFRLFERQRASKTGSQQRQHSGDARPQAASIDAANGSISVVYGRSNTSSHLETIFTAGPRPRSPRECQREARRARPPSARARPAPAPTAGR